LRRPARITISSNGARKPPSAHLDRYAGFDVLERSR